MNEPNDTNALIVSLFADFSVDGAAVPVKLLHYEGHGEPYVIFSQVDVGDLLYGDDKLLDTVEHYDFDVWSKGDYTAVIAALRARLEENGFVWQPSLSSGDLYEAETGYYHKTMNFARMKEE